MNKKALPYGILGYGKRDKYEWCRGCSREIFNERVVAFSVKKYGTPVCWKCQQKLTPEQIEELKNK